MAGSNGGGNGEYWGSTIVRVVATTAFIVLVAYTGNFIVSISVLAVGWVIARFMDAPRHQEMQDDMDRQAYDRYYKPFFDDALDYDEYKRTGKRRKSELEPRERDSD